MNIKTNTSNLNTILETIKSLPEAGTDLPELTDPATEAEVLSGKEIIDSTGAKKTGTMPNNGTVSQSLNAGGSYIIPKGYHDGTGKVTANSLASQTSGTAAANEILSGETAWVNGNKVTGTIATKTSSNLTASGATITVPAGYYASQATKSISTGSAKTPATTVTKNPTISVDSSGKITATVSGTQSVTPSVTAGYVSSGTAGTITVSGSATKQLTTQVAKTVTPTTSEQTAVTGGVYTTGEVKVAAIPSNYEDVADETATYTSLKDELAEVINSLPDAGSSGGSAVETCTVVIDNSANCLIRYVQCVVVGDDGKITTIQDNPNNYTSYTRNNVVCGSLMRCVTNHNGGASFENAIDLYPYDYTDDSYHIQAGAGETTTIHLTGGGAV